MERTEQKKRVCLITPGHLCNCPRLIKEAMALDQSGYQVHIIATAYLPFLADHDDIIKNSHPNWNIYMKHWERGSLSGLFKRYQHAFLRIADRIFSNSFLYVSLLNRNYHWQLKKAISINADLYIAHSAGSIAVAAVAASANKAKFGFDAEDYHTGEDLSPETLKWVDFAQKKHLAAASYITAASPLIATAYESHVPVHQVKTVLNVFPINKIPFIPRAANRPLRLFWFSQTIGKGRGLEWVFEALQGKKASEIEFHILGNLRPEESHYFSQLISKNCLPEGMVRFYEALPEGDLLRLAGQFDIGLSLETGIPLNRDLCLSNKLFVYLYAGLGIIATDTRAQLDFFKGQAEGTVWLPLARPEQLSQLLSSLIDSPQKVAIMRRYNDELAKKRYHWEKEQLKFLSIVKPCLREKSSS